MMELTPLQRATLSERFYKTKAAGWLYFLEPLYCIYNQSKHTTNWNQSDQGPERQRF